MSPTDHLLRYLEQQAINDGISLDQIDPWIAGALGVSVASLYAYLQVTMAAERWQLAQDARPCHHALSVALPVTAVE